MDVIPVIPPDLRPLVLLESGNFATSATSTTSTAASSTATTASRSCSTSTRPKSSSATRSGCCSRRSTRCSTTAAAAARCSARSNRPLKSLTDMIKGKQGRFRENLLGKRVDYSARSVIVVGPELKLHQCGLPKKIALELYQPFIIRRLKEHGLADTIKSAKKMLERRDPEVWDILEEVIYQHPVLLNRAPTLHRMGIQAFEPVLVEGNAIKIHPLVCKGFNADFDGDQMAVHLPLSHRGADRGARADAVARTTSSRPANGSPIITPSQDIVLGMFYITADREGDKGEFKLFNSVDEAIMAYELGKIAMHSRIFVRLTDRTQVVPDDKTGAVPIEDVAWKHARRAAQAPRSPTTQRKPRPTKFNEPGRSSRRSAAASSTTSFPTEMPFYNYALTRRAPAASSPTRYARARPPRDDRAARRHEGARLQARARSPACRFGITDIRIARQQADDPRRRPEEGRQDREELPAWAPSPSRSATASSSTSGPTPASRSPKT